jgi:hypothetical protein
MTLAGWDTLELIMEAKARDYPQWFSPDQGRQPLALDQPAAGHRPVVHLPGRKHAALWPVRIHHAPDPGRLDLQDERDGTLWMDAGHRDQPGRLVGGFRRRHELHEWHAPVPLAHEKGVFDRALKFLLKLQHGAPVRRFNWTMTVNPLLDTAPETYPENGADEGHADARKTWAEAASAGRVADAVPPAPVERDRLRHPLLPGSFDEIVTVPKWARRLHRVVRDLPEELATYKGFIRNRDAMVEWLSKYDDGAPTSPGWWPED